MLESDLYEPIKQYLTGQGYEVKAEIGAADLVAVRDDEPPLIVELKTGFTLSLIHQAIERQAITDSVYIAAPTGQGQRFRRALKRNKLLCRRLGLGLITVRPRDSQVVIHLDPAPYQPRQSKHRLSRLLNEFKRRRGDPNLGGVNRRKIMTAYRQDAIACVRFLAVVGESKASLVAEGTSVPNARLIMAANHYGWFERVRRGVYRLDPAAAEDYAPALEEGT